VISVTSFFRDHESFEFLEREIIPQLFAGKGPHDEVRVWSAGCATGEEAYSLAMLLAEYRSKLDDPPKIQVFATDIDEHANRKSS
jgi:two-component system, chemotaxis family, CheB/CheR fusion protein